MLDSSGERYIKKEKIKSFVILTANPLTAAITGFLTVDTLFQ